MIYVGRDIADEDDVEELRDKITAILDILKIKGIINTEVDHYDVCDFRNMLQEEQRENE